MAGMISVIVPARDCEAVIGPCLDSLEAQARKPDQIIVVDDASKDKTRDVAASYQGVELVTRSETGGFAGTCLSGLEKARGDWIAVLNADTETHPGWLQEMEAAAGQTENIGMVASRVLLAEPAGIVDSAGLRMHRSGMVFLREHGRPDLPDEAMPRFERVFGPAGSAALYSRRAIEEAGFFERDYFLFYEDADLAWRMRWKGFDCVLANRARVLHRHSYAVRKTGVARRYYLHLNRGRTMVRNWPLSWFFLNLLWIAPYNAGSLLVAAREGGLASALKARVDFVRGLGKDLSSRREIFAGANTDPQQLRQWLSIDRLLWKNGEDHER